jgi:ribonuclease-3
LKRLDRLCTELGYRFTDSALLEAALTHRSAGSVNNERLEFLGDAILNFTIAAELYRRFDAASEGELSRLRASLVRGETLALLARELSLGDYISLGQGELKSGGYERDSTLADTLEAVIGAVYLDGGLEACQIMLRSLYHHRFVSLSPTTQLKDPKTRLQEYLQSRKMALPVYSVLEIKGEAHAQTFLVECHAAGVCATQGEGNSRRRAEQDAACKVLEFIEGQH